jgi:hypothetical protein
VVLRGSAYIWTISRGSHRCCCCCLTLQLGWRYSGFVAQWNTPLLCVCGGGHHLAWWRKCVCCPKPSAASIISSMADLPSSVGPRCADAASSLEAAAVCVWDPGRCNKGMHGRGQAGYASCSKTHQSGVVVVVVVVAVATFCWKLSKASPRACAHYVALHSCRGGACASHCQFVSSLHHGCQASTYPLCTWFLPHCSSDDDAALSMS